MTLEQLLAMIIRALVSGLGNAGGTTPPPAPTPAPSTTTTTVVGDPNDLFRRVRHWETPEGYLTMRMMRSQLVKASGIPDVWGEGGSKSDADVVAEMTKMKGYCEEVRLDA